MEESVYLVLGCYGRKENGFVLCPSAENRILKLDESLVYISEIWDYLEAVGLVDKPMININAIKNFIFKMQDRFDQKIKRLWTETEFRMLERYLHMHKECGLYIRLIVVKEGKEPLELEPVEEKVKIKATKVEPAEPQFNNVVPFRSRR